jgi:purine-nucleoside phosphorylase
MQTLGRMYKSYSASDYRSFFALSENYRVEGMLVWGGWNRRQKISVLQESLMGRGAQFNVLPNFLARMLEFAIDGRSYWFDVSYGGARLSEYLHLACLFGSRKNILLGTCGGLDVKVNACDFVVPTFSYGNESTTRVYRPEVCDHKHFPSKELSDRLAHAIKPSYKVWQGPTITNQAMLAETIEDVKRWSEQGYLGVEMEAATVFAVSNHFAVPSAAILFVGDNLIRGETVLEAAYKNGKQMREVTESEQYRVALAELLGA